MHVLVVDDDPLAAELVAAILESVGHEVTLADNALAALETLAATPTIAAVVSDLHMPLMSGMELFRELRQQGAMPAFVLLTGDDPAGVLAVEPALDECLLKDFALEERLPRALDAVLARRAGNTS